MTIADMKELKRFNSLEQIAEIMARYIMVDVPKMPPDVFMGHLCSRPDSWFVLAGEVGIIFLTDIIPGFTANLNVLFWDKRFPAPRREAVLSVLATAFPRFDLTRVNAITPHTNHPLADKLTKMGFQQEGCLRQAWPGGADTLLFGMLKEELPCHVLPIPTDSLD